MCYLKPIYAVVVFWVTPSLYLSWLFFRSWLNTLGRSPRQKMHLLKYPSLKEPFEKLNETGECGACQQPIAPVLGSLQCENIRLVYVYTNLRWLVSCNHNILLCSSKLGKVLYMRPQERVFLLISSLRTLCVTCELLMLNTHDACAEWPWGFVR